MIYCIIFHYYTSTISEDFFKDLDYSLATVVASKERVAAVLIIFGEREKMLFVDEDWSVWSVEACKAKAVIFVDAEKMKSRTSFGLNGLRISVTKEILQSDFVGKGFCIL